MTDSGGIILAHPLSIEYVASGVIREWSADRRLCIFNVHNGYQETINAWVKDARTVIERWEDSIPCLMLHDFQRALGFNKYFRECFESLFTFRPELKRHVAVITPDDPAADVIRSVIDTRQASVDKDYCVHWEVFTARKQALSWLLYQHKLHQQ